MSFILKREDKRKRNSDKRFTLRMDTQLFDEISFAAQVHRRSVAKEIEEAIAIYVEEFLSDYSAQQAADQPEYEYVLVSEPEDQ